MKTALKLAITFLIIFCPLSSLLAQDNYTIRGTIKSANDNLPSGNVMALHPSDSSLITGTFFLDGIFQLEDIDESQILVKLSSLEFNDTYIPVSRTSEMLIDLGAINVAQSAIALEELIVVGKRPEFTQKSDGTLEVLVENTILAASNSVIEILSKSPDILLDEDENPVVFGKGAAIIYLNGKRITNSQLSMIAPSNIKKLEIIRNPSAKYDAEGAAVIQITTIQRSGDGYQVNLKQNITTSQFAGTDTRTSVGLSMNKGRFSTSANYAFRQGKSRNNLYTTRDRLPEDGFLLTDLLTEWQYDLENFSNYDVGLQWAPNNRSYISAEYTGFTEQLGGHQISTNSITDDEGLSQYKSDINLDSRDQNHTLSLNYATDLDTLGSSIFYGGQYSTFALNADNLIEETSNEYGTNTNRWLKNIQGLNVYLLSNQLDYAKVFQNQNKFELGAKYSSVQNDFSLDFLTSPDNVDFQLEKGLSNEFLYTEKIAAAYASFQQKWSQQFHFSYGLRVESTDYSLQLSELEGEPISDKYTNFFPNFSANLATDNGNSFNISYSSRIIRVPYDRLNPVLYYQDPYTSIQGNPNLKPQKSHAFELTNKLGKTTFKLGYTYSIDPLGGGAIRGEHPKSYILIRLNYDTRHEAYASLARTFTTDWWTSTNFVSLRYTDINDTINGYRSVGSKPNLYFYSDNQFKVGALFNINANFSYLGEEYEEVFYRERSYNLSFSIDKSFLDNNLNVRLIANDVLNSMQAAGNYNLANTEIFFKRKWTSNYFRFALSYKFGRLKKATYKNKEVGRSEQNRI